MAGLDYLFFGWGIGDFVCTLAIPGLDFITLCFLLSLEAVKPLGWVANTISIFILQKTGLIVL